jgi:ketosteroid isomerase-like protein
MTPQDLVEIEEIKRVKYRYMRGVDLRDAEVLASTLTEDATAAYSAGKLSFEGRDAIISFIIGAMPAGDFLTAHRVHHPEIELTGPDTATARWALDDTVIILSANITLRGAAYYEDEMLKRKGEWRIHRTGYRRLYEETTSRDGVNLTDHWWVGTEYEPSTP